MASLRNFENKVFLVFKMFYDYTECVHCVNWQKTAQTLFSNSFEMGDCTYIALVIFAVQIHALLQWSREEVDPQICVSLKDGRYVKGFLYCQDSRGTLLLAHVEEICKLDDTGKKVAVLYGLHLVTIYAFLGEILRRYLELVLLPPELIKRVWLRA